MGTDVEIKSFWGRFTIKDQESCAKAIRNGGIAAMISAAVSGAFGIASFFTSSSNSIISHFLDPFQLVDATLMLVLGVFIFRKSRVAATFMVIYFVASKVLEWRWLTPQAFMIAIVFVLFYVTAMRGTYMWHSKYRGDTLKANS